MPAGVLFLDSISPSSGFSRVSRREAEACFDPIFDGIGGFHRIYPDLPGMGHTVAPETIRSADDVLESLIGFGCAAAADLVDHYPHATLAVLDDAGHALPHEQPDLLQALITEWLTRVERPTDP